jgi:hypothetical protein
VQAPPLPPWLASRVLGEDEKVTWVGGPRFNPSWERYVTHPSLVLVAVVLGAAGVAGGWLAGGTQPEVLGAAVAAAVALFLGSIFVVALWSGYFTRLVVTTKRLLILQGYEVCRTWRMEDLPPSLIRHRMRGAEVESRTVDLDTLKTLVGSPSDKFVDAKTIMSLGKQIDNIKARDRGRP